MPTTVSSHSVSVLPSHRTFTTHANETILAAAIRQNITLPYGCKDGACGSCKCKMLQGTVSVQSHSSHALSDAEKAQNYILTCRATPQSDIAIESRQVTHQDAFPIRKMPVRVTTLEPLSHDVMRVQLQLPAQQSNFRYHAGQYLEFVLKDGSRRAYSMATAPHAVQEMPTPGLELHIRHLPGGLFTDHVFQDMKPRDILRIEGPFGSFYLREDSERPIVLLASGTGFAPIKAMLEHMQHRCIQRPVSLYWGGRRPADLYLHDWVLEQADAMPQLRYIPVISDAQPEDAWQGRTGYVHQAVLQDTPDLAGHEVYACGAPAMVEAARQDYCQHGKLCPDDFHADAFTSAADKAA